MTAVITGIRKVGTKNFTYDLTFDLGPVTAVVEGEAISAGTDLTAISVSGDDASEPPVVEVYDQEAVTGDVVPSCLSEQFKPYAVLQWRSIAPNIDYFLIEQFVSAAWTEVKKLRGDSTTGYYQYETDTLADDTTHQFRISTYDTQGYVSSVVPIDITMKRIPDTPSIDTAYSSGSGDITISAR